MVKKRQTLDALAAVKAGDLSKAVGVAAKAMEGGLPLVMEALQAGFALGQASNTGENPPPEAMGFLRFLAAERRRGVPVTPRGPWNIASRDRRNMRRLPRRRVRLGAWKSFVAASSRSRSSGVGGGSP
jgi:hypothetical protein